MVAQTPDSTELDANDTGPESIATIHAVSAALRSISHCASFSQVLTVMSVECLQGSIGNLGPSTERHSDPDQLELAKNIHRLFRGSKLVRFEDYESTTHRRDLCYIRTASEWLSLVMEDLRLAQEQLDHGLVVVNKMQNSQVGVECATTASEKARTAAYTTGRMLYVQLHEVMNAATSRGLPQSLCFDQSSTDEITVKSADLVSDLALLASSANLSSPQYSLAEESTQQALESASVLADLAARHLLVVCQALDLRAIHHAYLTKLEQPFRVLNGQFWSAAKDSEALHKTLWSALVDLFDDFDETMTLDDDARFHTIADQLQASLFDVPGNSAAEATDPAQLQSWTDQLAEMLRTVFTACYIAYVANGDATSLTGVATKRMYNAVRHDMDVPFFNMSFLDKDAQWDTNSDSERVARVPQDITVVDSIERIRGAWTSGELMRSVAQCMKATKTSE